VIGYGTTGTTQEHILLIFFGPRGRNGKDTLLETLSYVLGEDIAGACSPDVFIASERKGSAGGPSEHLYALMGKRLVWTSESAEDAKLNTNQVKLVTGGGQIVCRPCFGHQVTFKPTHLPILLTNFKPRAPDYDDALWERVHLVPFTRRFVDNPAGEIERQKDLLLKEKLKQEAPGILAWIVQGAMRWYENGRLIPPKGVKLATSTYKTEMNPLAEFIADRCFLAPNVSIPNPDLWNAYKAWADENGECSPLGRKTFSQRIEALEGVAKGHDGRTRVWYGVDLKKECTAPKKLDTK
jgi:putative DNA primase/helicase